MKHLNVGQWAGDRRHQAAVQSFIPAGMATFALVTIQPSGYPHTAAFFEWRLLLFHALRDLGHEVVVATNRFPEGATAIVFGVHLISKELPVELPKGCILINTEQLAAHPGWIQQCGELSSRGHVIWDYSSENLKALQGAFPDARVHRMRLGYHPQLERVSANRDGSEGFVFYGSLTSHRQEVIARISLSERLRMQGFFGIYGWQRDGLLARSLAVVNIHSYATRILEWPRILFLIANRVPCLALLHESTTADDDQLSYVLSVDEQCPTPELEDWFSMPDVLRAHAERMYERFRQDVPQAPIVEALLDETLARGFAVSLLPLKQPGWRPCRFQSDPDPLWYEHTYSWLSSDPRSLATYHREIGAARQYHPHPGFSEHFRKPLKLPSLVMSARQGQSPLSCAVALHFYSLERARLFFASFGCHLAGSADFFVSTSSENVAIGLRNIAAEYGLSLQLAIIANRGRDLPSKYLLFAERLAAYDLVLYSHGKDSSLEWFDDHNRSLAGSRERIEAVLDLFIQDPELGLVFPDYLPSLVPGIGWGSMRDLVDELLAFSGHSTAQIELLEFPAGGIFWARPACLQLIHNIGLTLSDLPEEPLAKDHTLLHAIERMPCLSCEFMGYRWAKLARMDDAFSQASAGRWRSGSVEADQLDPLPITRGSSGVINEAPPEGQGQIGMERGSAVVVDTLAKAPAFDPGGMAEEALDWDLAVDVACPQQAQVDLSRVALWLQDQTGPVSLLHLHHYDRLGYLPLMWRHLLRAAKAAGFKPFVTTCSGFDAEARDFLEAEGIVAIRRPNRGRCLAAFKDTALLCEALASAGLLLKTLVLLNDSTLPISVGSTPIANLQALVEAASAPVPILAGLTDSFERGFHLQSFCLVANQALLADPAWCLFWLGLETDFSKYDLIGAGEVGLSLCLASVGVQLKPLFPLVDRLLSHDTAQKELAFCKDMTFDRLNSSLFLPRTLLEEGCSFVKKLALFAVPTSGLELTAACLRLITPNVRADFTCDLNHLLASRNHPQDGNVE